MEKNKKNKESERGDEEKITSTARSEVKEATEGAEGDEEAKENREIFEKIKPSISSILASFSNLRTIPTSEGYDVLWGKYDDLKKTFENFETSEKLELFKNEYVRRLLENAAANLETRIQEIKDAPTLNYTNSAKKETGEAFDEIRDMLSSPVSMRVVLERHEKKFGKRPESNTERAENEENKENKEIRLTKMRSIISSIKSNFSSFERPIEKDKQGKCEKLEKEYNVLKKIVEEFTDNEEAFYEKYLKKFTKKAKNELKRNVDYLSIMANKVNKSRTPGFSFEYSEELINETTGVIKTVNDTFSGLQKIEMYNFV